MRECEREFHDNYWLVVERELRVKQYFSLRVMFRWLCDEDDYRSHDNDSAYPNILNVTHIYVFRNDISNMYKNENDYFLCLLMCIYEI